MYYLRWSQGAGARVVAGGWAGRRLRLLAAGLSGYVLQPRLLRAARVCVPHKLCAAATHASTRLVMSYPTIIVCRMRLIVKKKLRRPPLWKRMPFFGIFFPKVLPRCRVSRACQCHSIGCRVEIALRAKKAAGCRVQVALCAIESRQALRRHHHTPTYPKVHTKKAARLRQRQQSSGFSSVFKHLLFTNSCV